MKWSQPWDDRIGRHPFPAEPVGWQQPQCPSWPTLKLSTSGCLVYLQTRMKLDSTGKKRQGLPPRFMTVKALSMKLSPWLPTLGSSKILLFPTLFGIKGEKKTAIQSVQCIAPILEVGLYRQGTLVIRSSGLHLPRMKWRFWQFAGRRGRE